MSQPVLIAGGGPTGLLLAAELALAGVEAIVLEKSTERVEASAGMALHGRSLELLDQRGVRDRIPAGDIFTWPRTPFAFIWLDVDAVDPREHTFAHPQWRTEQLLEERARELGADIRRGHEVVGLTQDADGVRVRVRTPQGEQELAGSYLVGADGPSSTVRELAGIGFSGDGKTYRGVLGDVELASDSHEAFSGGLTEEGVFGALPLRPGVLRLMTIEFGVEPPADDVPVTEDELRGAVERVTGKAPDIRRTDFLARFGGRTRLADRYRDGRVLLAGDAAHVLFISGTQGLNTGLHDAANLGWKLAAEINGWAPTGLLDSYEAERRPVGEQVTRHARAQMALMHPLHRAAPLRTMFEEIAGIAAVNEYLLKLPTATGYPLPRPEGEERTPHPLLGRPVPAAALTGAGHASLAEPLRGGRGVLLDLSGGAADLAAAAGWAARVDVVTAEAAEGIDAPALLIRPDGHVAWVDTPEGDPAGLRHALALWFGAGA
ncbi:FAD-dependent monooxygenase [Kitasatospora sp. NPDC056184]|uniref:FAD-dependent monooxygenase n=1 Tax=Kitasatospora sp. NPDC056184 TaxID=3345738 RepID=UPI0035DD841A